MAITRGAGTEIIRAHHFEAIEGAGNHNLIVGVQHHIYTVLSVIIHCAGLSSTSHYARLLIYGYDSFAGDATEEIWLWKGTIQEADTFVWNDKFSFAGCEPTGFTGALSTVAEQDALADQGPATPQTLYVSTQHADDNYDVTVTGFAGTISVSKCPGDVCDNGKGE